VRPDDPKDTYPLMHTCITNTEKTHIHNSYMYVIGYTVIADLLFETYDNRYSSWPVDDAWGWTNQAGSNLSRERVNKRVSLIKGVYFINNRFLTCSLRHFIRYSNFPLFYSVINLFSGNPECDTG